MTMKFSLPLVSKVTVMPVSVLPITASVNAALIAVVMSLSVAMSVGSRRYGTRSVSPNDAVGFHQRPNALVNLVHGQAGNRGQVNRYIASAALRDGQDLRGSVKGGCLDYTSASAASYRQFKVVDAGTPREGDDVVGNRPADKRVLHLCVAGDIRGNHAIRYRAERADHHNLAGRVARIIASRQCPSPKLVRASPAVFSALVPPFRIGITGKPALVVSSSASGWRRSVR